MTEERPKQAIDRGPRGESRNLRRRVVMWLVLIGLLAVFTEVVLRVGIALIGLDLAFNRGYPSELYVDDPAVGFRLRPGFVGTFPDALYEDVEIRVNSDGHRDREFPPRSERTRILVVGDSITFGAGVRAEDRYTERLQASLCGDDRCEVLNVGVNNYQAENYLALLRSDIADIDPDWVVVGLCMNDIRPKAGPRDLDVALRRGFRNQLRGLLARFAVVRVGSMIWRALTVDAEAYEQRWIRLATAAWSDETRLAAMRETMREIQSVVAGYGSRLAVVLFPEKHQFEDPQAFGVPYRAAAVMVEGLDVPVVSLFAPMRSAIEAGHLSLEEIYLTRDNIHFTPPAQVWIADEIERRLGDQLVSARESSAPQRVR